MIENLWPGSKVVKQNPDGTVIVRSPDGKIHRLNPSVLERVRGRGASGLTNGSTGFEYFIKNKYRTPRSGRWDSRLFNRYTRVAAQHANPSAMDKQVMGIPQLARTTGRRVELVRPVPTKGGLI